MEPYPHQFATALFSFLYHLASYDAGGEALVSCGMMEALLKVNSPLFPSPPLPSALLSLQSVSLTSCLSVSLPALMSQVMQTVIFCFRALSSRLHSFLGFDEQHIDL